MSTLPEKLKALAVLLHEIEAFQHSPEVQEAWRDRAQTCDDASVIAATVEVPQESAQWLRETINFNPKLVSLLYDMDLLPEQFDEGTPRWRLMSMVVVGYRAAILAMAEPPEAPKS